MEWLESKDKGKTNCVNIKHVIGDLGDLEKGSVVTVKFNSYHYQAKVVNLLDWNLPTLQKLGQFTYNRSRSRVYLEITFSLPKKYGHGIL